MRLLDLIFSLPKKNKPTLGIEFGRFSDAHKTPEQQAAWERSVEAFEVGRTLEAYSQFLAFLKNGDGTNLSSHITEGALHFEFWQGSRRIRGTATAQHLRAESRIAHTDGQLNVGFMRRLMEQNFHLKYCRFALTPDDCLAIVFDTHTVDGSPLKLLHALRELAINADKQDDLLLDEFQSLRAVDASEDLAPVPDTEKQVKYDYLRHEIESAFALLDAREPDPVKSPGAYVYLLLGMAFRLDYLIHSQGVMMNSFEQIFQNYFKKDNRNVSAKLQGLREGFEQLYNRPQAALMGEMYRTRSTFGINPGVGHDRIKSLIDGELSKMDLHLQQTHADPIALAVPNYIVGYALFHYAPPMIDRDLFHLFFEVTQAPFFKNLGFTHERVQANGLPKKSAIEAAIRDIARRHAARYPQLRPNPARLDYSSMPRFAQSYLRMVGDM
jgi:hypothetical protein